MAATRAIEHIPEPPELTSLRAIFASSAEPPFQGMMKLAKKYGPLYAFRAQDSRRFLVASSFALVDEVCDESRFDKALGLAEKRLRAFAGDGLFTAYTQEPNWSKAHNILMPSFSMQAVRAYLPQMGDIVEQMLLKWERQNPDESIDVVDDMTRLTLDTIGLCGFNHRFNSFYHDGPPAFAKQLADVLREVGESIARTAPDDAAEQRFHDNIASMNAVVDRLIQERRASGEEGAKVADLLDKALRGVDPRTGERLDDTNIRYQLITFLIAGHETTTSLLSFTLGELLTRPDLVKEAQEEIDRVLGGDVHAIPDIAQMNKLDLTARILKESLRLWPPVAFFSRRAYQPTVLAGRYPVAPDDVILVLVPGLHRDPAIWTDPDRFDPDRFRAEIEQQRPANAYKPFGSGQRSCIGRQFAMQEATLALGKILQRFDLDNFTQCSLVPQQRATLKPAAFRMKVRPRAPRPPITPTIKPAPKAAAAPAPAVKPGEDGVISLHHTPLLVLYGSNFGTSEAFARHIAEDGAARGFTVTTAPLDDHADKLPRDGAVVIVTSSYNGTPPDNARRFVEAIQRDAGRSDALKGVSYAVFGCGHRDWGPTFQAVPRLIDEGLHALGARRIHALGAGDARDDLDGMFRRWYEPLWGAIEAGLGLHVGTAPEAPRGPRYTVEILPDPLPNPFTATFGARALRIRVNRELQQRRGPGPAERSTRHIELELPEGVRYQAGDHLGVIPHNPMPLVQRALRRFLLAADARIRLKSRVATSLPIDEPLSALRLLAQHVELQDVATRPQIKTLADHTDDPGTRAKLLALAGDDEVSVARYRDSVLSPRRSILDLLEDHPACALPLAVYLEMLPPLRPRYYSISSSPLVDPRRCSLTVGVVDAPARRGVGQYLGVCSSYLAQQPVDSYLYGFVRRPSSQFFPPADPATPMILIGPGTGVAPFRGFLEERAIQKAQGKAVGPSLLFFGCRHPGQDFLYQDELELLAAQGVTKLFCAFSRVDGKPKTYVQHRIQEHADDVWDLIDRGAVIYVCGEATRMAPDVRATFAAVYRAKTGASAEDAETWLAGLTAENRYLTDVWGGT